MSTWLYLGTWAGGAVGRRQGWWEVKVNLGGTTTWIGIRVDRD